MKKTLFLALALVMAGYAAAENVLRVWSNGQIVYEISANEADSVTFTQAQDQLELASKFWPLVMDNSTIEKYATKMAADLRADDVDNFIYIWNNYVAGDNRGLNFYGNGEGYMSLVVGNDSWCGLGLFLGEKGSAVNAAVKLANEIVADPDSYYLHMAIKSTDAASHAFYVLNNENTHFTLGRNWVSDAPVYADFSRNGTWQEFSIPMSVLARGIDLGGLLIQSGMNVFVALSELIPGAELNLDAVYFYKK